MTTETKGTSVISSEISEVNGTVAFTVKDIGTVTLRICDCSAAVRHYAMLHGFKQRLADNAALSRNAETGASATPQEKFDAISQLVEHYHTGTEAWSIARSGDSAPRQGLLLQCLMQLQPAKTEGELRDWLKGKSKADQVALLASPKIAPLADAIRAKAVKASGIDVDSLLDEIA